MESKKETRHLMMMETIMKVSGSSITLTKPKATHMIPVRRIPPLGRVEKVVEGTNGKGRKCDEEGGGNKRR